MLPFIASLLLGLAPAPAVIPSIEDPHMKGIRLVACGSPSTREGWSGTMFHVADNKYVSAFHVVNGGICFDAETMTQLSVLYADSKNDFMVFTSSVKLDDVIFKIACSPYIIGHTYQSLGWANGEKLRSIPLKATSIYTSKSFRVEDESAAHLRQMTGRIIGGMSGGPVVDGNWVVYGINNAGNTMFNISWSRELADSAFCK